jgi:proline iminopeptidase
MLRHWLDNAEPARRARFDECSERAAAATDPEERARWIDAADAARRWHDLEFDPTPIDSRYERPKEEAFAWAGAVMADAGRVDWGRVRAAQPAPVLLCLGRSDHLIPHTSWDGVEPRPHQVVTALFERSGHTPFVEEPERFTDVLARWLSDR